MNEKRSTQRRSQFQGSKKKARKQAFLKREEKRKNNRMLPVLVDNSKKALAISDNMMQVPMLNAFINPVVPVEVPYVLLDK